MTQLRLWTPEAPEEPEMAWDRMRWDGVRTVPDVEPSPAKTWRLSRWFIEYWVPWQLLAGDDPARDKTVLGYYDALRWALRIAGDPLLSDVGDGWLNRVYAGLGKTTYCRAATVGTLRPLSAETQAKHRRQIATCLRELTWQGLIKPIRPRRRVRRRSGKIRPAPKPAFGVADLRRIVAQAATVPVRGFTGPRLASLWRSIYGLAYYTGLRREAWLSVTWAHVSETDGVYWLSVPAEITKDSEPWEGPLYPRLVTELLGLRGVASWLDVAGRLIPWPHGADWLLSRHKQICAAVGLTGRGRDLHALRRSHLQTLAEAGFGAEKQSLALLAGHSDAATTFGHYTSLGRLRAKYLVQMPAIW